MNTFKKALFAGATALAMSMTAQAGSINVGGVVWDPAAPADFQSNGNIYESFAGSVGDTVSGFGVMTNFNGTTSNVFCPTCELTYTFSLDLTLGQLADPAALPELSPGVSNPLFGLFVFSFDNVVFDIWVDNTPDYDELNPSFANASDGVNFLSMTNNGLLTGTATNLFDVNNVLGAGSGFLDVVGGIAANNFDTNGKLNGSDMAFTSSFTKANINVPGYPLFGSLDLAGNSIPEPSTIALLGLGLIGFAGARKRKV